MNHFGHLMTESAAAKVCRLSVWTLRSYRKQNIGPLWCKYARKVYYPEGSIHNFLKSRLQPLGGEVIPTRLTGAKNIVRELAL